MEIQREGSGQIEQRLTSIWRCQDVRIEREEDSTEWKTIETDLWLVDDNIVEQKKKNQKERQSFLNDSTMIKSWKQKQTREWVQ